MCSKLSMTLLRYPAHYFGGYCASTPGRTCALEPLVIFDANSARTVGDVSVNDGSDLVLYVTRMQRVILVFVAEYITYNMEMLDSTRSSGSVAVLIS